MPSNAHDNSRPFSNQSVFEDDWNTGPTITTTVTTSRPVTPRRELQNEPVSEIMHSLKTVSMQFDEQKLEMGRQLAAMITDLDLQVWLICYHC